jgi:glucose-6-phosphate dehydrogenase assembly protein OpcA
MSFDLVDTNAAEINSTLLEARRRAGSPGSGMVLTLVIATNETDHYDALRAATEAAREHPSRIVVAIARPGRSGHRLDAEIRMPGEAGPGEVLLLRLHGELAFHADSVVLPLLLPDAPVVAWWPGLAPPVPCEDPVGALANRRVTDAAAAPDPLAELYKRREGYRPGDTDLAWTRLTPWRSMLAAGLDQPYAPVSGAEVEAEPDNPSAELLALWLEWGLGVEVIRKQSDGPGITAVRVHTEEGEIALTRPDGRLAVFTRPHQPDRPVALKRRSTSELIAEELRHLDPDNVYEEAIARVSYPEEQPAPTAAP